MFKKRNITLCASNCKRIRENQCFTSGYYSISLSQALIGPITKLSTELPRQSSYARKIEGSRRRGRPKIKLIERMKALVGQPLPLLTTVQRSHRNMMETYQAS